MNKLKIMGLIAAVFGLAALIGWLHFEEEARRQESRILALEREVAMKDLALADQKVRLVEFEEARETEAAGVKTKAFLEWYNKDMHFN